MDFDATGENGYFIQNTLFCNLDLLYLPCQDGSPVNALRPRHNGWHFPDEIFKYILLNENVLNVIKISLKFVPRDPINTILVMVQIMAWH